MLCRVEPRHELAAILAAFLAYTLNFTLNNLMPIG